MSKAQVVGAHSFGVYTDATGLHGLNWNGSRRLVEFMNRREHLLRETQ